MKAGDYLVFKFPTWSWSSAPNSKRRDFLPQDKQFLITRQVPCRHRATGYDGGLHGTDVGDDYELIQDFTATKNEEATVADLDALTTADNGESSPLNEESDYVDLTAQTYERTYNVYISYSTSYRVPKIYLSGFDGNGAPLSPKAMFDDIVSDYKNKTVTIESAPFLDNLMLISIHPCRHAGVMRLLLNHAEARKIEEVANPNETEEWEDLEQTLQVDRYLVLFLKFIASVTPTIEYDFTMSAL